VLLFFVPRLNNGSLNLVGVGYPYPLLKRWPKRLSRRNTLAYLIFAVVMATALIGYLSMRMKTPNDPAKSVDSFQRAIKALAPEREGKGPKS
jgi:hypothetical protein